MRGAKALRTMVGAGGSGARRSLAPSGSDWLVVALYAPAFWIAHDLAALWGGEGFYSLWFPAAGVRFALLWRLGARLAPAAALTELAVQCAAGVVDFARPDWPAEVLGVIRPPLAYGLAIWAVRRLTERPRLAMATPPMPLGLAAVAAPVAAALAALPWSLLRPDLTQVETARDVVGSLTAFTLGDLLGVLLVAPPLLWTADRLSGAVPPLSRIDAWPLVEATLVMAAALGAVRLLSAIDLGLPATPVLLGVAWVGLRFGRALAWVSVALAAAFVLPRTAEDLDLAARLDIHMNLAAIVVVGYLAGSYADAQARAAADLARRDRLLLQAERLKTLRAMSVAVIHEVSQPLSTLAIEARHLHDLSARADREIAEAAALIDRKAHALADLVRRLRRFGGRVADRPSLLPVAALVDVALGLVLAEARAAGVALDAAHVDPGLVVMAQEVELTQALVNLVRNAVQAAGRGSAVRVATEPTGEASVAITVANRRSGQPRPPGEGMGVGALVARAIVEAHGGRLSREDRADTIVHQMHLPLAGSPS